MPPDVTDHTPLLATRPRVVPPTVHRILIGVRRSSFLLALFVLFFVTYLCLGAVVFGSMEQPLETQLRIDMRKRIEKFLFKYPSLQGFFSIIFYI